MKRHIDVVIPTAFLVICMIGSPAMADMQQPKKLVPAQLGSTKNVHAYGNTLMCGQPSAADFAEAKKRGFKIVVTLRMPGEIDWQEAETVRSLGMAFQRIPFRAPDTLTEQVFDKARKLLKSAQQDGPLLLHCGSANRVGALWLAHRVLDHGLSVEAAEKEARQVGLKTEAYREKAVRYIQRQQSNR